MKTRSALIGLSALALLCLFAPSPALAQSGPGDSLQLCLHHGSGVLYLKEQCKKKDTPLPWPSGSGITGYEIVREAAVSLPDGHGNVQAVCPEGKKVLGGGYGIVGGLPGIVKSAVPADDSHLGSFYGVSFDSGGSDPIVVDVYAVCAHAEE